MPANRKIDELMSQGLGLHQSGKLVEAEAIYRRVLKSEPSHPAANHLIGLSLYQQGKADLAVPHLKRAVQMRGHDPEYNANLGVALSAAGRPLEALPAFEQALKLKPDFAAALNNRGLALRKLERFEEAAASYRAALALLPDEPGFLRNLGNVQSALGDLHGAEATYRKVMALQPDHPVAIQGLGNTLELLGRPDEAIALMTAQIAKNPRQPDFHRIRAHANWVAGNPEAAAADYREVIALNPMDAEAHRMLGVIVPRTSEDDEVRAVRTLIERNDLTEDQRSQLEFALGQAYDDLGDVDRAFAHFSRGNALQAKLRPFDLGKARAEFDELRRLFDDMPDDAIPPLAPPTGPIVIVGLPRSGKSSLEGMLGRHPDLVGLGELPILGNLVSELRRRLGAERPRLAELMMDLSGLGRRYDDALAGISSRRQRPMDTMPNNFLQVAFLRLAMPQARVIHSVRDPLEHSAALYEKYFALGGNEYASELSTIAAYSALYRDLMAYWHSRFPEFVLDVNVADLRQSAEPAMRRLLHFVGASWCAACTEPYTGEPRLGHAVKRSPAMEQARLGHYLAVQGI